jgi:hypothetical protein
MRSIVDRRQRGESPSWRAQQATGMGDTSWAALIRTASTGSTLATLSG